MIRIRTIPQRLWQRLRVKLQIADGPSPGDMSALYRHKLDLLRPKSSPHSACPHFRSQNVQKRRILRGCSDFPLSDQMM
jgi:hypothetical protein